MFFDLMDQYQMEWAVKPCIAFLNSKYLENKDLPEMIRKRRIQLKKKLLENFRNSTQVIGESEKRLLKFILLKTTNMLQNQVQVATTSPSQIATANE